MPPSMVSIEKFVEVLQTGQTDITKAIDELFADPGALMGTDLYRQLQQGGALDSLSPEMRAIGTEKGVTDKEMDHIDEWPNDQKDEVREKMVASVANNRPMHFFWELHRYDNEAIEILDPDAAGDITVIFLSPKSNLHPPDAQGNINVSVG